MLRYQAKLFAPKATEEEKRNHVTYSNILSELSSWAEIMLKKFPGSYVELRELRPILLGTYKLEGGKIAQAEPVVKFKEAEDHSH